MLLPTWVDSEAWEEFVDMRKRLKKPLTERAMIRAIVRLTALKEAGHCPNASLLQSADHYWQDLYEPRQMAITAVQGHQVQRTNQFLAELDAHKSTPPPAAILALVNKVRKVA